MSGDTKLLRMAGLVRGLRYLTSSYCSDGRLLAGLARLATSLLAPTLAQAQCDPEWSDRFRLPGLDQTAKAIAQFDDGSGPALFITGELSSVFSVDVRHVARWDGTAWSAVGDPLGPGVPGFGTSLVVAEYQGSAALYAGFTITVPDSSVVKRWTGTQWEQLGGPLAQEWPHYVNALAWYDDGSGPALYAAGSLPVFGNVARWNGAAWERVGAGLDQFVSALAIFDDGSGPALCAAGHITQPGGVFRWKGAAWEPLGGGLEGLHGWEADALCETVYDDGLGPALYVGGDFATADGNTALGLARWNGQAWSEVGQGFSGFPVSSLAVFDDRSGKGPRLFAAGSSVLDIGESLAAFDGAAWEVVPVLSETSLTTVGVFSSPDAEALAVSGGFEDIGGIATPRLAMYNARASGDGGPYWSAPGAGLGINGRVSALLPIKHPKDGTPLMVAAGEFSFAGTTPGQGVAAFDGEQWRPMGTGNMDYGAEVRAMAMFDEGAGERLFVAGLFHHIGGIYADYIARWDGKKWSDLHSQCQSGGIDALAAFDDGSGPALYIGGSFGCLGNLYADNIARWTGKVYEPLGAELNGRVRALAVYDDGRGGGPALFAGGDFTRSGEEVVLRIARWDGASWLPLNLGVNGPVHALAVYDEDGPGPLKPRLYVGGDFTRAGDHTVRDIAAWDGQYWAGVGDVNGGVPVVRALASIDDDGLPETPERLYVGGEFTLAGGVPVSNLAVLDGSTWSAPGAVQGQACQTQCAQGVRALAGWSADPTGVWVAGGFTRAGSLAAASVSRLGCPGGLCAADMNGDGGLNLFDYLVFITFFNAGDQRADFEPDGVLDLFDFLAYTNAFNAGC